MTLQNCSYMQNKTMVHSHQGSQTATLTQHRVHNSPPPKLQNHALWCSKDRHHWNELMHSTNA